MSTLKPSPSNNAVIYAILAINSEVALQKDYLDSEDVPSEDAANEAEILEELEQAFMEFVEIYKARLKLDKTLPSLDELLNSQL